MSQAWKNMENPRKMLENPGIEAYDKQQRDGVIVSNEYAVKIENLLSPLVGDLMAKMALKSQCKSLGIVPEEIAPQHLDQLASKIGFALSIQGHKDDAENIISTINGMSSDELEKRGRVKGTILANVMDYISLKWGVKLADDLKRMTGHADEFKPGTWHTLIMLEGTFERIEEEKGQEGRSLTYDMGLHMMSSLKFDNARYLFADDEKSLTESYSNLKIIFDLNNLRVVKKGDKELHIKFDEESSQDFNKFLMGLCEGILKHKGMTGRIEDISDPESPETVVISTKYD